MGEVTYSKEITILPSNLNGAGKSETKAWHNDTHSRRQKGSHKGNFGNLKIVVMITATVSSVVIIIAAEGEEMVSGIDKLF